jgi:TPP-dependent 2-oxoacid decarboxylase
MPHLGVYAGDGSNAGVRERVESSDLILHIGAVKSDFNTAVRAKQDHSHSSPY